MGLGDLVKVQIRFGVLVILSTSLVALTASSADAAGGSWGSGAGVLGFGGSWGGGGLIGGRAPVRNLLGRLNASAANLGAGSNGVLLSNGLSGGGSLGAGVIGSPQLAGSVFGGSRGGLLGTGLGNGLLRNGIVGGTRVAVGGARAAVGGAVGGVRGAIQGVRNGFSLGRYYGGSVGGYSGGGFSGGVYNSGIYNGGVYSGGLSGATSYGSLGSSIAPTYFPAAAAPSYVAAPTYVAPYVAPAPIAESYALPSYDLPSYDIASYDYPSYDYSSFASPLSNYVVEQSYPVGDYGFEPGYPIQEFSSPLDFGYPIDSSFSSGFPLSGIPVDSGFPINSGFPIDGGFGGGFPIDGGLPIYDGLPINSGFPVEGFSTGGFPVEGSIVGDGFSGGDSFNSSTILDGGSIDSMLDTSGAPLDTGIELNSQNPSGGGGEYYDGSGDGPPNPFGEPNLPGPADDGTFIDQPSNDTKAVLNLILPKHAEVLINGKVTKTRGSHRSYVSRHLRENRDYKYQVKAIVMRGGKKTVRTKMVTMRPGVDQTVKLDFDDTVTTLALKVPVDAKVELCGKPTQQTGIHRSYSTSSLPEGETWKSYKVSVEYVVDGKKRVEERTLDLQAGQQHELAIGIDSAGSRVAAR